MKHGNQEEASGEMGIEKQQQGPQVGSWAHFKELQWKGTTSCHTRIVADG